jgi:simple sugar transport system permease protein
VPGIGVIPVQFVQALPYILTVLLLAGFVGTSRAPRAIGIPFVKSR